MKSTFTKLSSLALITCALAACAHFKKDSNPATPYQQCNGLQQQMTFMNSDMNGNNVSTFQLQQQMTPVRQQYNKMNCEQVIANGKKSK